MKKIFLKLKQWAKKLKSYIYALYLSYQDPKTKWYAKMLIIFTVGYALSPIDLIPDFIPVLGYLDDLILLPGMIWLSIKLIPKEVWGICYAQASQKLPKNKWAGMIVIIIWVILGLILFLQWYKS